MRRIEFTEVIRPINFFGYSLSGYLRLWGIPKGNHKKILLLLGCTQRLSRQDTINKGYSENGICRYLKDRVVGEIANSIEKALMVRQGYRPHKGWFKIKKFELA